MVKVLVCAASKHGATAEIAARIAERLTDQGLEAELRDPVEVTAVAGYDAAIVGSGIYAGRWLEPARSVVNRLAGEAAGRPLWLFSSGPVGDPPVPKDDPQEPVALAASAGATEHRVFAGKLDKAALGAGERMLVRALRVPEGDFRDWDAVDRWAVGIARSISSAVG